MSANDPRGLYRGLPSCRAPGTTAARLGYPLTEHDWDVIEFYLGVENERAEAFRASENARLNELARQKAAEKAELDAIRARARENQRALLRQLSAIRRRPAVGRR